MREGHPASHLFSFGYHVGRNAYGVSNPHTSGLSRTLLAVRSIADYLGQILHVSQFCLGIPFSGMCLTPYLLALCIYTEKVSGCSMEIPLLSIQLHIFQCSRGLPFLQFLFCDVRDESADVVHHLLLVLGEVT